MAASTFESRQIVALLVRNLHLTFADPTSSFLVSKNVLESFQFTSVASEQT